MKTRKYIYLFVLLLAVSALAACTATEAAPTEAIEEPAAPTETAALIPTDPPVPTETPVPEPTATSVPYPAARAYHTLIYDSKAAKIILIGGSAEALVKPFNEIWTYDTASNVWSLVNSINSDHPVGAYDSQRDQLLIYTAIRVKSTSEGESTAIMDVLDLNSNTLERLDVTDIPFGYAFAPLVYDPEADRAVLFGGWVYDDNSGSNNETFIYDPESKSWTQMSPDISPPARKDHMMVYHPTLDRVILFGGDERDEHTWAYDVDTDTWTDLAVTNTPPLRLNSAMVYVDSLDQIILFGGYSGGEPLNDMWAFDQVENIWIELHPENAPSARAFHAMAYDAANDKVVLFGGGETWDAANLTNETWVYDPQTNAWTDMTPGH
jgi:N-acetylneuraminic acid mutarotase